MRLKVAQKKMHAVQLIGSGEVLEAALEAWKSMLGICRGLGRLSRLSRQKGGLVLGCPWLNNLVREARFVVM